MDPSLIIQNLNVGVLKEPRGFIKVLQLIFTICAYGTTTSFFTKMVISVPCQNGTSPENVNVYIHYNFRFTEPYTACGSSLSFPHDFSSDSGFFVAIGVLASLFVIAALILYLVMSEKYETNPSFPLGDCVAHAIFTVLFLAASSAWANSLTGLKTATSLQTINMENQDLCHKQCSITEIPNYAKLNISIILGFLNVFLFGCNLWFLYKETPLHKGNKQTQQDIEPTIN